VAGFFSFFRDLVLLLLFYVHKKLSVTEMASCAFITTRSDHVHASNMNKGMPNKDGMVYGD